MNTSSRTSFQVGLLVFGAIILAVACWVFFNGQIQKEETYNFTLLFHDAQGLTKQGNVFLAGVKIGSVTDVSLSPDATQAVVHARILKKWRIPADSIFTISASLLGGAASVNIRPPQQPVAGETYVAPNQVVQGQQLVTLADVQAQAGGLMGQFGKTAQKANLLLDQATVAARSLNGILADQRIKGQLASTVANLDQASEQGLLLTQQLRVALAEDNSQVKGTLGNVSATSQQLQQITTQNRDKLNQIVANLNQASGQFAQLSTKANQTLGQGDTLQNLSDTVSNLKQATQKLNQIEGDVSRLTSDPQVQSDLKTTLHNAAIASGNASKLIDRLTAISGAGRARGPGSVSFQSRLDFTQNFRTDKFRTDFDLYAPLSSTDFARLGVYDLTGHNNINLQYGQASPYNKRLTYRAGVYASKVGVGADYDLFGSGTFSADLYDPNRLRLDARQRFRINKQSSIYLGVEDVPRTNGVTLGFELSK